MTDFILNRGDGFFLELFRHFFKFVFPEVKKNGVVDFGNDFVAEFLVGKDGKNINQGGAGNQGEGHDGVS